MNTSPILSTPFPIIFAVAIFVIVFLLVYKKKKEAHDKMQQAIKDQEAEMARRKNCLKCNVRYKPDQDVSWVVLSEERRMTNKSNKLYKIISLKCTCPECGELKTYTEKFAVEVMEKSGTTGHRVHKRYKYKLEDIIKTYFS